MIIGKTLPFVAGGYLGHAAGDERGAADLPRSVPRKFLLLFGSTLLFLLTTLGAGLFISTVSHTQTAGHDGDRLFFQPFFMLSGFTFPIRNMPQLAQWLTF